METIHIEGRQYDTFASEEGLNGRRRWIGKLFEEGDYGPKGKYDRAKIDAFAASFPPTGVIVKDTHRKDHQEGFLDSLMRADQTRVARVWADDAPDGRRILRGEFDAPAWLDHAARNATKKVSIGLTQDRERIQEVSLVLNPHVRDAAVFEREAASAFASSPLFSDFAAAHPDDARLVTEAAKAPIQPKTMPLTRDQLWADFTAKPENAGSKREEFDALFAAPAPQPPTNQEDPALRAEIDALKRQMETQAAQFAASEDENDALKFYRDNIEKYGPVGEEEAKADFALARKVDRLTLTTFSANAEGSEEKKLRDRVGKKAKLFSMAPGALPSFSNPQPVNGGTGVFADDDFKKEEDK